MTDFPAYSREELDDRTRSIIRATQFDSRGVRNADVTVGSDYDISSRMLGALSFLIQEAGKAGLRALDKRQSVGAFLREHASISGIGATLFETTQAAVRATGKIAVTCSSTAAATLTAGNTFYGPDGVAYTVDTSVSTLAWAAKSFTAGPRSTRGIVFHGVTALAAAAQGELYRDAVTNEIFALRGYSLYPYHFTQPYLELVDDPTEGDTFNRINGVIANVTAVVAGAAGNREPRDALFMSPWLSTFSSAQVLWIDGGRDALSPSQMQQALKSLYGERLEIMTLEQLRRIAIATPRVSVREAYLFPGESTVGEGELTVVPTGPVRSIASSQDAVDVAAYMDASTPATERHVGSAPSLLPAFWQITLRVSPGFAPDWRYSSQLTTQSYDGASTTTRIQHSVAVGGVTFVAGDRLIVSMSRGATFEDSCLVIRRVSAVGSNYIDVTPALPFAPTYAIVSQGGPFADELLETIENYFDNQAPTMDGQYRYPSPDNVSAVQAFQAAVARVRGVVDVVVTEPAGAVTPGYGELLYPRRIVIQVFT